MAYSYLTCNQAVFLGGGGREEEKKKNAWYIYFISDLPPPN